MKLKSFLVGASIIGTGVVSYNAGKVVAYVRSLKTAMDFGEELMPGFKEMATKKVSDTVIESIFNKRKEEEEETH